jgi:xanthine dehydrogenase YagR molybdenum-binding subunit
MDLAEYLVPVHADIPESDAILLDGFDDRANALGVKGVGELANCGANAAVPNAVFNATGCACAISPSPSRRCCPGCRSW